MTIEAVQVISDLNENYPRANDLIKEGDDHIRMIKNALKRTFPNVKGTVNITEGALNSLNDMMQVGPTGLRFTKPVYLSSSLEVAGPINVNNTVNAGQIELTAAKPFIDFHYNNDGRDFTTRIIAESAPDTLQVVAYNGDVYLDIIGRLNVRSSARVLGSLTVDGNITSQSLTSAGNVTGGGLIANANARVNGNIQTGSINNLGDLNQNGHDISNINVAHAQAFDAVQWVHAANHIQSGYVHSTGDVRGDSSVIAENGAVYSGGAGGAFMPHDGNIHGAVFGGDYITNWLQSDNSNLLRTTGRLRGIDGILNGGEVGQNRHTIQVRLDGRGMGIPLHDSDERVKEDIKPIDPKIGYDAINKVNTYSFKYKDEKWTDEEGVEHTDTGGHWDIGIIAQDVEKHIPQAIYWVEEGGIKQVNMLPLITNLIGAVKHLSKKVEELEAKLEA